MTRAQEEEVRQVLAMVVKFSRHIAPRERPDALAACRDVLTAIVFEAEAQWN